MGGPGSSDEGSANGGAVATHGRDIDPGEPGDIHALAQQLRVDSILCTTHAGSGHPTSCLSSADLMAVLVARHFAYDWTSPTSETNDHLVFSKGHAAALLYAVFKAVGVVSDQELFTTYGRAGSQLHGHPSPDLPWVSVATGSIGQGLPVAVGIALAGRCLDEVPYQVWVLCGDGELAEGSMWEALDKASYYELANLTAIVDINGLGQQGETALGWDLDAYRRRVEAFGCRAILIDGHDVAAIDQALADARQEHHRPTVVLARTVKGQGVPEIAGRLDWHGRPLPPELARHAIARLGGHRHLRVHGLMPVAAGPPAGRKPPPPVVLPTYEVGSTVATARAYGEALCALGARPDVVALDADVGDSTFARCSPLPTRSGSSRCSWLNSNWWPPPSVSAFEATWPSPPRWGPISLGRLTSSAWPAISGVDLRLVGCHAGVEEAEGGPGISAGYIARAAARLVAEEVPA